MSEEIKLTPKLTEEEYHHYQNKANELARAHGVSKVYPIIFIVPVTLERVICYLKEPLFDTKIRVMDKSVTVGFYSAGNELRQSILIQESSDPRTFGEGSECDTFKMGVVDECVTMVKRMENQFKKN